MLVVLLSPIRRSVNFFSFPYREIRLQSLIACYFSLSLLIIFNRSSYWLIIVAASNFHKSFLRKCYGESSFQLSSPSHFQCRKNVFIKLCFNLNNLVRESSALHYKRNMYTKTELSLQKAIVGMRELKNCGSWCQFRMVVTVNIWKSYILTAGQGISIKVIFAVM